MTTIKLRKGTFRHIESELYEYADTKKEIELLRNEMLYGGKYADEDAVDGSGHLPGPAPARTAVLLAGHKRLEHLESLIQAIDSVVERLSPERQQLIRLKYWTRSQPLAWDGIAQRLNVSTRTALRWRDEIIYAIADKLGWT